MTAVPTALEARQLAERAIATGPPDCLTMAWDLLLRSYRMAQAEAPRRWTATGREAPDGELWPSPGPTESLVA